ncbi:hypothetical protein [Larkinella soli]|uniref:hypothetical protein n=1 Tax=Larkinella soli TaxID=1770527 RepID=UPI000FFC1E7F|nr:hypothetical protein [Larkinella soli]
MNFLDSLKNTFRQAHYLSLDVVLGAILSHCMAARLPDGHQKIDFATTLLLGVCVFLIYAADRLFDVRKGVGPAVPATPRHQFHAAHQRTLIQVLAGMGVLAIILLFFLPEGVFSFGVGLAVVCGAYVVAVFRLPALHATLKWKEPVVAVLYTAGVWGSAWSHRPAVSWPEIGLALLFLMIAFQNLLLFSVMEACEFPGNTYSLATALGLERSDVALRTLAVLVTVLALVIFFLADTRFAQRAAIIEGLMSAALYAIQRYPTPFLTNERYRWIGDGVFWLPALIL